MKLFIASLFCLVLVGCNPGTSSQSREESESKELAQAGMDQSAPSFTLESIDGKKVSLSDLKGKVVLLDFWATWCPPCKMSTPVLVKLNEKMKGKDFALLAINLGDDPEAVKKYVAKSGIVHTVLYIGESGVENDYSVRAIPTFYMIDKNGAIHKNYSGFYPGIENEWEKEINILLAKKN